MKFVPNGSIIKFLLIAVLSCGLAFLVGMADDHVYRY